MKEIYNFVLWQWRKFEFWQKCFVLSSAFFGAGLVAEAPYSYYLFMVPSFVVFGFMFKWVFWDGTRSAWERYKKERNGLLTTIRDADK